MRNISKPLSETGTSKISKTLGIWKTKATGLEKCVPYNQVNKYSTNKSKTNSTEQ